MNSLQRDRFVELIQEQQVQYIDLALNQTNALRRHDIIQSIVQNQISMGNLLDCRIVLPDIPNLRSSLSGDDNNSSNVRQPFNLGYAAKVTLPDRVGGWEFTLHAGSNLGGLPTGTVIDYCNIFYVIEGNEFTRFHLTELVGV